LNLFKCRCMVNICKQIVDDFLTNAYDEDKTEDQLWNEYSSWGEDPFIIVTDGEDNCSFSAWDYAKNRIREIVGKNKKPTPKGPVLK